METKVSEIICFFSLERRNETINVTNVHQKWQWM